MRVPCDNCRCKHQNFCVRWRKPVIGKLRRQNAEVRTFGLYGVSHKTCFDVTMQVILLMVVFLLLANCDFAQENSAAVILKITAAFSFYY